MAARYRVKPGRGMSVLGMIVGIIFVFIGITQVSQFGPFGIVWTLVAIGITGYYAYNAFSVNGTSIYEAEVQDGSAESIDYDTKIRQLHRLREDDIISEEEYQKKKTELLNKKW